jgi:hypothetical protein
MGGMKTLIVYCSGNTTRSIKSVAHVRVADCQLLAISRTVETFHHWWWGGGVLFWAA